MSAGPSLDSHRSKESKFDMDLLDCIQVLKILFKDDRQTLDVILSLINKKHREKIAYDYINKGQ